MSFRGAKDDIGGNEQDVPPRSSRRSHCRLSLRESSGFGEQLTSRERISFRCFRGAKGDTGFACKSRAGAAYSHRSLHTFLNYAIHLSLLILYRRTRLKVGSRKSGNNPDYFPGWEDHPEKPDGLYPAVASLEGHFKWMLSNEESKLVVLVTFFQQQRMPEKEATKKAKPKEKS